MRVFLLAAAFLSLCVSPVAQCDTAQRVRYVAKLAFFSPPAGSVRNCVLVSVALLSEPQKPIDVRPTDAFMQAECAHFAATWRSAMPAHQAQLHFTYDAAVWYQDEPDTPLYFRDVYM